jgi:hypothetical protein
MDAHGSSSLIEQIITCANVYGAAALTNASAPQHHNPNNIYIRGYFELLLYLRHLFVYYNSKVDDSVLLERAKDWPWLKFLSHLSHSASVESVGIITYNYDVWLERLLQVHGIPFVVEGFGPKQPSTKIRLFKPHGSISFCHNKSIPRDSLTEITNKDLRDTNAPLSEFVVKYTDLDEVFPVTPLIPPAGHSLRFEQSMLGAGSQAADQGVGRSTTWSASIRLDSLECVKKLSADDRAIIAGLSYWHVDRDELDSLLVRLPSSIDVSMINPSVPLSLNAVLTSLFGSYRLFPSSNTLPLLFS